MFSQRNVTLLGSNVVFLILVASFYFLSPWSPLLFPFFSLIFYWTDYRMDEEMHVIFLFLTVIAALALVSLSRDNVFKAALIVEMLGIILISIGLGLHRNRLTLESGKAMGQAQELDLNIRDLEREINFYGAFESTASNQIQLRRDLTEAAKSLGSTLDPREVHVRLVRALERRFPGSRVHILPGQPSDPLVNWVVQTNASLLIKDVHTDERFAGTTGFDFRAAVLSPLLVMRRPYGFLRMEDARPGVFKTDDLRTVDLFSTLASLALENVQFFENVNDLATHDALTQLHTHRAFQSRLQEEVLRAGRGQTSVSLIMCDVDHFKRYNDAFGHPAGDHLLRTVAGVLTHHARPVDFTARYGGEEFCVILPGFGRARAVEFAELLRVKVAEEPFMFEGRRTGVTMSFGVACFPEDATTTSQLVRSADERLYKAKHGGRNQVVG